MAYNKLIDLNLLSNFLSKIKSLIPTKTSDLENDSEYITGMEILSYGNSTWNDFLTAYTAKKVVYCRASSNSNPASGSQTRLAFMAYVNNADNPTNVEFQYYRSVSSHTNTQQGDQVFVYKLDKTSGWSVITREASSKVVAGTNMTSSYSNDTVTLNASIPSNVSDLTNDSGYITGITSSDVTTALGYTPSSTDTTYSAGNGIDITNTIIKNTQGIEYITGTQTTSTAVWTGNSTDETLYIGKIIAYYLPYAGTSTAATLTLTMGNGATTEAIPLRRTGSNTVTTHFAANNVIILIYDGTYWRVSAYYDSDANTVPTGYCTTAASTAAKSATCTYGYRDDTNYFPCLFRYANTAANATLAIASYGTTALPIYVNGERTSATNTFGRGVILFLYYDGAYYCYNDGRLPILMDGVVTSVQDYTNELKNTINKVSQVTTSTNIGPTSIATFEASVENIPLKGLTVNIEPVQAEGTPTSETPLPISGWTGCKLHRTGVSLIGGDAFIGYTFSKTTTGYEFSYNGSTISDRASAWADIRGLPAGRYTIVMLNPSYPEGAEINIRRITAGSTVTMGTIISSTAYGRRTYDIPENTTSLQLYIIPDTMSLNTSITMSDIVLVREADDDFPEPYKGNVYDITFPSEAGTVYGGTFDVVNRKLNSYPYYSSYNGEQLVGPWVSSMDVYVEGTTPTIGAQVVDMGGTATSYDLSDAPEITTLLGENNIWANCGNITVIYGEYLTQIKNNINDLDKRVKIIEDNDPLFDKLIHLPDDDSFFNKGTFTGTGTYTKLSKNSFSLSGGSGTTYYCYPLHGTDRVVSGSNTQLPTRLLATDFVEIPANGVWGNTSYSLGIQFYCEANTTASNRNLELVLICANIQNGEIVGTPEIVNNYVTNNKEYGSTILRLRGFGYAPLERYTHYAIFARSRSRASSAVATMTLKLVQSPRLLQYILYSGNVAETSLTATAAHAPNSFILNNDRLYKVLTQIQTGEEIVVGTNVTQVSILEMLTSLLSNTENIPNTSSISNTGLISIKHDSTELFTIQLPLYNGGVSNGT